MPSRKNFKAPDSTVVESGDATERFLAHLLGRVIGPDDVSVGRLLRLARARGAQVTAAFVRRTLEDVVRRGELERVGMVYDPQARRQVVAYRIVATPVRENQ